MERGHRAAMDAKHRREREAGGPDPAGAVDAAPMQVGHPHSAPHDEAVLGQLRTRSSACGTQRRVKTAEVSPVGKQILGVIGDTWSR